MSKWYKELFGENAILLADGCAVVEDDKGRIFVVGTPTDEELDEELQHNCDAMGCGTVGPHLIKTFKSEKAKQKIIDKMEQRLSENSADLQSILGDILNMLESD